MTKTKKGGRRTGSGRPLKNVSGYAQIQVSKEVKNLLASKKNSMKVGKIIC